MARVCSFWSLELRVAGCGLRLSDVRWGRAMLYAGKDLYAAE